MCDLCSVWPGEVKPALTSSHAVRVMGQEVSHWGQSIRPAWTGSRWGHRVSSFPLPPTHPTGNLPLLLSQDQLSATATKTPCTSSTPNPTAPNLDTGDRGTNSMLFQYLNFMSHLIHTLLFSLLTPLFWSFPSGNCTLWDLFNHLTSTTV